MTNMMKTIQMTNLRKTGLQYSMEIYNYSTVYILFSVWYIFQNTLTANFCCRPDSTDEKDHHKKAKKKKKHKHDERDEDNPNDEDEPTGD